MKILVADTSPLISLLVTNHLFILFDLYNEIYIPEAVWDELKSHVSIVAHRADIESLLYTLIHGNPTYRSMVTPPTDAW